MKQEDKGLVLRGLLLLGLISVLVAFVLVVLFWRRPQEPPAAKKEEPEIYVAVLTASSAVPGTGTCWYALTTKLSETLPSAPGWDIRYNAAIALARRGSPEVPWPLLREMLDEKLQMRNHRVVQPDGREVYDEAAARAFMISALKALAVWHEKQPPEAKKNIPPDLRAIYATVDQLTQSSFTELKIQAEKARATFFR